MAANPPSFEPAGPRAHSAPLTGPGPGCYQEPVDKPITEKERQQAEFCRNECPVCTKAREKQKGFRFWFVKSIEGGLCPYCKAYAKVYGRKAHEPAPESARQ